MLLARLGVDVARDGADFSTIYICIEDTVWCEGEYKFKSEQGGLDALATELIRIGLALITDRGVTDLHYRIDTTGGYGAGPADALRGQRGEALRNALGEDHVRVFDVIFNHTKTLRDPTQFYDLITELYAVVGEIMQHGELVILHPPAELEQDLTGRKWIDAYRGGQFVKRLEPKQAFKNTFGRSPDHGDGFVLAVAPPEAFGVTAEIEYIAAYACRGLNQILGRRARVQVHLRRSNSIHISCRRQTAHVCCYSWDRWCNIYRC
jgi:hypothetical protein